MAKPLAGHRLDEKTKLCECGEDMGPSRDGARVKHRAHKAELEAMHIDAIEVEAPGLTTRERTPEERAQIEALQDQLSMYGMGRTEDIAKAAQRAADVVVARHRRNQRIVAASAVPVRQRTGMDAALVAVGRLVSAGVFR